MSAVSFRLMKGPTTGELRFSILTDNSQFDYSIPISVGAKYSFKEIPRVDSTSAVVNRELLVAALEGIARALKEDEDGKIFDMMTNGEERDG